MADCDLYCNFKKCRKVLTFTIWVTSCSHVFCDDHGFTSNEQERKCPACNLDLSGDFDVVRSNINPSEEFKSMILAGLRPEIILEMTNRALSFWIYQMSQEKNYHQLMMKHWKDRCVEFESAYQSLMVKVKNDREVDNKKLTDVQNDLEIANRKIKELEEKLGERNRLVQNIPSKYEAPRRFGPTTADSDDFDVRSVPPSQATRVSDTNSFSFRPRPVNLRPSSVDTTRKVAIKKVVTAEHDINTQLSGQPASPNQNWQVSAPNQVSGVASDAQTSRNSARSKPVATNLPSQVVGHTDNQTTSPLHTDFHTKAMTISDLEKSRSAPLSTSTLSKFSLQFATTVSSTRRSLSTTVGLRSGFTTESSTTRAGMTKNGNGVVFSASTSARTTSKTATSQWPTGTVSTTLFPSINGTANKGNTTNIIRKQVIIDVPEFGCKEGEKKDQDDVCRKVL